MFKIRSLKAVKGKIKVKQTKAGPFLQHRKLHRPTFMLRHNVELQHRQHRVGPARHQCGARWQPHGQNVGGGSSVCANKINTAPISIGAI